MVISVGLVWAFLGVGGVLLLFATLKFEFGGGGTTAATTIGLVLIGVSVLLMFAQGDTGEVVAVTDGKLAVVEIHGVPIALEVSGIELDVGDEVKVDNPLWGKEEEKWGVVSFSREVSD